MIRLKALTRSTMPQPGGEPGRLTGQRRHGELRDVGEHVRRQRPVLLLGRAHRLVAGLQPGLPVGQWVGIGAIMVETRLPWVPFCSSVRTETGTAATSGASGSASWSSSQCRSAPADSAITTSLTVMPGTASLTCLTSPKGRLDERPAPVRADRPVERRRRARAGRGGRARPSLSRPSTRSTTGSRGRTGLRGQRRRRPQQVVGQPGGPQRLAGERQRAAHEHRQRAGLPSPCHGGAGGSVGPALGRQVQHRGEDVVARHPVDRRVVHLAVDRLAAALQPVDEVELPQRAAPVERAGVQPGGLLGELPVVARLGQGELADVVLDVEVRVLDPVRLVERRAAPRPGGAGTAG